MHRNKKHVQIYTRIYCFNQLKFCPSVFRFPSLLKWRIFHEIPKESWDVFTFYLKPQPKPPCFLVDGHCSTRSSSHHNNTAKCYPCWTWTCNWNPIFTSCSVEDTSSKWSTFSQSSYVCSTRVEYEFLHRPKSKRNKRTFNLTKSEFESAEMTFTYHRRKTK